MQYHDENCPSPLSVDEARTVNGALKADPQLAPALNYWMSTVSVIKVGLEAQFSETETVIAAIDRHLEAARRFFGASARPRGLVL